MKCWVGTFLCNQRRCMLIRLDWSIYFASGACQCALLLKSKKFEWGCPLRLRCPPEEECCCDCIPELPTKLRKLWPWVGGNWGWTWANGFPLTAGSWADAILRRSTSSLSFSLRAAKNVRTGMHMILSKTWNMFGPNGLKMLPCSPKTLPCIFRSINNYGISIRSKTFWQVSNI